MQSAVSAQDTTGACDVVGSGGEEEAGSATAPASPGGAVAGIGRGSRTGGGSSKDSEANRLQVVSVSLQEGEQPVSTALIPNSPQGTAQGHICFWESPRNGVGVLAP